MPRNPRISFHLEGSRQDGGLVRAQDFVDWLEHVLTCLKRLEHGRPGKTETVYRVAQLSLGSAVVELEAVSDTDNGETAAAVVDQFLQGISAFEKGKLQRLPFDAETKEAFASLGVPLRRQLKRVTVQSDGHSFSLKPEDASIIKIEDRVESISVSSYSGFVDALNVHKEPVFYLYPTTGPSRIPCSFNAPTLLDDVRSAIKRYTTVFGVLEFAADSPFPQRIVVDRLEVNPRESELPSLRSLFGSLPNLTGGVESVRFIRQKRDATA
jgi:hypothetical protein